MDWFQKVKSQESRRSERDQSSADRRMDKIYRGAGCRPQVDLEIGVLIEAMHPIAAVELIDVVDYVLADSLLRWEKVALLQSSTGRQFQIHYLSDFVIE
jgi:hypothetical protein